MAAPFLTGVGILVVGPVAATVVMSAFRWDLVGPATPRGLGNVRELLADPVFRAALRNSLLLLVALIPLRLLLVTALAALFVRPGRGMRAGRAAVFVPSLMPEAAYAVLWLWVLNPIYGPVNVVLGDLGLPTPSWLTEPTPARWAVVLIVLFQVGEAFAIALVARSLVATELLEIAASCGAGRWATFVRVTVPLMAPGLVLIAVRDATLALQASFIPALLVTGGGPPPYSTTYLPRFVHLQAFEYLRYGYAAAAATLALLLTASIAWLQFRIVRRWRSAITLDRRPVARGRAPA
jgi:multiple sugar transport system permease protein